jgi:predicted dinucleotide-binding enzyme
MVKPPPRTPPCWRLLHDIEKFHLSACPNLADRLSSVFKTLNQVGFEAMADASGFAVQPVVFVAGDDNPRMPLVMRLLSELGFQAVDAGKGSRCAAARAVRRALDPHGPDQ